MKRLLGVVSCLLLVVGLIGCGQQVPQIKTEVTTIPQPLGLVIRGTVYGTNQAELQGGVLNGVAIVLSGQSITKTTTSDASGEYSFTNIPEGTYIVMATKEAYQRAISASITVGTSLSPASDSMEKVYDFTMNNRPVVLSITPVTGATIEAAANTITVVFNEPIDQTSVRPTLTSQGMRTFAVADTQSLTTSWSADGKTLTITTGALLANKAYRFMLDQNTQAKDLSGNLLDTTGGTGAGGLSSTIYNNAFASANYDYRTASGGAPGAPTGLLLTVNNKTVIDFTDANVGGNLVVFSWLAPASGAVSGYKIYVGTSSSGPWALLDGATTNSLQTNVTAVNTKLYGEMYNADCIRQLAFVTDTVYFKVAAYNAEGETAGTAVATRDATKPTLTLLTSAGRVATNVGVPAALAAALTDFSAGASLNLGCYVVFSEPMNLASLTDPTKYTVTTGQTVSGATVVYNSGGTCVVQLTFATAITPFPGASQVTVLTTGPADLSGNVMDSTNNVARIN